MPCIQIKTNVSVSEEAAQAVKSQLGQIITCLPEKTEDWLMITLEDGCRMWFRGEKDKPMAIVEVKVFGDSVDRAASERMTREVCGLLWRFFLISAAVKGTGSEEEEGSRAFGTAKST